MGKMLTEDDKKFKIELEIANTFMSRLKGLMFCPSLSVEKGLIFYNCSSIHTCFMRFPIDVIYLDSSYVVLGKETISPWHVGKHFRGTKMVVEMNAGVAENLKTGDQLHLGESR